MRPQRGALVGAVATGCALLPATAIGQSTSSGGGTITDIQGTAIVHVSPISADTLPILCRDGARPELGFVTEMTDAEWQPAFSVTLARPESTPDQAEVALELEGVRYAASFPAGESGEGFYTALATVTSPDDSASRMISLTANCSERLPRGG